jgi:hypothetical protein
LGQVAVFALQNLVPVHFIDKDTPSKSHSTKVAERDRHAAAEFNRITKNTGEQGCLVLYGSAHFVGGTDTYRGGGRCLGDLLELSYVLFT